MPNHSCCSVCAASNTKMSAITSRPSSPKLKSEALRNGGQNNKGNGNEGKGKSKGRGKGQDQGKGGCGGPDKKNEKNEEKSGGNPNPTPWGSNLDQLVVSRTWDLAHANCTPFWKRRT